ncbi:MAG TPA: DHA2 family efflux MFS transporter permease subunit [Bacteroidota bacterium]|nr:DHA2 family efflux MFS transporter permease subunit [Bacteroidota bacterium]
MADDHPHSLRGRIIGQIPSLHHEHDMYQWWVLINIMIGTFMAVLDVTIVNVALPKIMANFGISVDKVEWVLTAYLLIFAVMLPASGWVADHFGYKRTYFLSLFLFTFGSFLCGISWDENTLIIFRVIQGAGAGFLMPVGMAIITREFPPEKRGMALGFWAISAAASVSFGPLIGGYLCDNFSWHMIFDVNVPVGLFAMVATLIIQREYKTESVRSFDFVGFLSVTVFLTTLLLALADANAAWNTGGWTSPFILTCFALASVSFVIFMIVEFSIEHPLIDLRLLKDYNFGITNLVMFIFGLGMFGSTFLLPLYLQNSLGYSAYQAGEVFLPVGILQGFMSPVAGYLSDRGNPKLPAVVGVLLLAVSFYLNYFLTLSSEHAQIMLSLYLRGLGLGLMFTPLSALALANIPREKMGQASGLFNVIRQVGGSFGIAILGSVLTQRINFHATRYAEAVNQYSAPFKSRVFILQSFVHNVAGGTTMLTGMRAKALLASNVFQQAFVAGIADDFLLAGVITLVCVFPIFILRTGKRGGEKVAAME